MSFLWKSKEVWADFKFVSFPLTKYGSWKDAPTVKPMIL